MQGVEGAHASTRYSGTCSPSSNDLLFSHIPHVTLFSIGSSFLSIQNSTTACLVSWVQDRTMARCTKERMDHGFNGCKLRYKSTETSPGFQHSSRAVLLLGSPWSFRYGLSSLSSIPTQGSLSAQCAEGRICGSLRRSGTLCSLVLFGDGRRVGAWQRRAGHWRPVVQ